MDAAKVSTDINFMFFCIDDIFFNENYVLAKAELILVAVLTVSNLFNI